MTNQANAITQKLFETTETFETDTKSFIDSFDTNELLSFSNADEKRKRLVGAYNVFSLTIKNHIETYEATIIKLSILICQTDIMCNVELTKKLASEFDRYSLFLGSVKLFVTNCETLLSKKDSSLTQATILRYARELHTALTNYKNNF